MRVRTGYSFHVAAGHVRDVASRVKEIGWKELPIVDRNSTFGFTKATKIAKELGLRPVYGVELAVVPELKEKKISPDYWSFFARSNLGPLHDLIREATKREVPQLLYEEAVAAPGLVKMTGDRPLLARIKPSEVAVALAPSTPMGLYREAKKLGFNFLASSDNFYPRETDREFWRVVMSSREDEGSFKKFSRDSFFQARADTRSYGQHIMSDDEWRESVWFATEEDMNQALSLRDKMLGLCSAQMKQASLLSPDTELNLRQKCEAGAASLGVDLSAPVYKERLDRELAMIEEKKFADYFHILADLIGYAKKIMIVGPARGSSCGSLVCYLMGITTIDPIPFGLLFERFIDRTRPDLPDIDVDFSDAQRHKVFEYAEKKYGSDHVAKLGSVNFFKPRSALNQVGIALKIPRHQIDRVSEGAVKRSQGDSRAAFTIEDTFQATEAGRDLLREYPEIVLATKMEGHPAAASRHAAGIVVTDGPVREYVAVNSSNNTTMCDKKDAEDLNLLKIDALGLTQLSIFERCLGMIGVEPKSGWLEKIPLDDPAAFDVVNQGKFSGVFQFTGSTVQSLANEMKLEKFDDVVALTALARPGPIGSGSADTWLKRRTGKEDVSYPHPLFVEALEKTYGVFVYQEQVMKICRDVGGLSWDEVNALRRAMSKSLGQEFFDKFGVKFKASAIVRGVPKTIIDRVWDELCQYGAMAFNESHSVAYGYVSYWSMWLKAHHPLEFAAATLDAEPSPAKQIVTLRELDQEGISYVPVDPDKSTGHWEVSGNRLIGPLTNIEGIGPAALEEILDARKKGIELRPVIRKKLDNPKTKIDSLTPVMDAVLSLHPTLEDAGIVTDPTNIIDVQIDDRREVVVIGVPIKINQSDENTLLKIAKRAANGKPGAYTGPHICLNMFVRDDTDEILCRVFRFDYERIGKEIFERGKAGKAIYAVKGFIPRWATFRMIQVSRVKYLGDMP